jgi:hypothetical protein
MVIDFVPVEFYTPLYFHILLVVILLTFLHCQVKTFTYNSNTVKTSLGGLLFFAFVLIYIGLRPINGVFIDMTIYAYTFERVAGGDSLITSDLFFDYFLIICTKIMTVESFFLACAIIYVVPIYLVCKKWFKEYWFYAFLMLVGSFSFWAYGTNGIRNGMATSLFLFAISREKRILQIVLLLLAVNFHKTMMLPALGFIITLLYNKPKGFLYFWILAIPLSLLLPGFWEGIFGSIMEDERAAYFTEESYSDSFSSSGFRWDFLLYSATGVFAGCYYLFKMKIKDPIYIQLFNTFLFANAFWILVIRASFSNRFAYLSWFMLGLVIIYPWLKQQLVQNQFKKIGLILLAYYSFTYIMNIILIKQ